MISNTLNRLFSFKLPLSPIPIPIPIAINKGDILSDFVKGNKLISEGKYTQAIDCFDECIKIFKNINQENNIQYYLSKEKKAYCLSRQAAYDLFEKELNEVIVLSKKYFPSYLNKAYANYISFLSLTNISKANAILNNIILKDNVSMEIKGYFLTEKALIAYLTNQSTEAIDITHHIMNEYKHDYYLYAINSHNLGIMTKSLALIQQAFNIFRHQCSSSKCNYGLTIVELCKQAGINKKKGTSNYFNYGLSYFSEYNKSDPFSRMFFNLLAKRYEEHKMMLYTEGLYQNALSITNQSNSPIDDYNHLHIQMSYGNFLLSQKKRSEEGRTIIYKCRSKLNTFPEWYSKLSSLYYLIYDFENQSTII